MSEHSPLHESKSFNDIIAEAHNLYKKKVEGFSEKAVITLEKDHRVVTTYTAENASKTCGEEMASTPTRGDRARAETSKGTRRAQKPSDNQKAETSSASKPPFLARGASLLYEPPKEKGLLENSALCEALQSKVKIHETTINDMKGVIHKLQADVTALQQQYETIYINYMGLKAEFNNRRQSEGIGRSISRNKTTRSDNNKSFIRPIV